MKKTIAALVLAVVCGIITPQAAFASAITIEGVVYDKFNQPVPDVTVVAWCGGGISFFGGSDKTDADGYYVIHTNSDDCPFNNELTVTTDVDNDGLSDGATHTQVHTSTYISIHLGDYTSVVIPEYDWIGAGVAVLAGVGIIGVVRRARLASARQA